MGTDGWRSGTSPSSRSRDLQQSHNHPDTQKQPCVGGRGVPHPEAPLSHPCTTGTERSPPPDSQGAQHPWERIPRLHPLHLAEQGGRRRGCWRQALPHGPLLRAREWKQIAKQQEKKKKKSTTTSPRPSARGSRQTPVIFIRASLGRGEGTSLSLPLGDTLSSLSFMAHDCFAPLRNSPFVQRRQRVRAPQRLRGKRKATEASRNIIRNLNMTPLLHSETWHHKTPGL